MPLAAQLGGRWLRDCYELDIAPAPNDPDAALKEELLLKSALAGTHFLGHIPNPVGICTSSSNHFPKLWSLMQCLRLVLIVQERLLAAVAVCVADGRLLDNAGSRALQEAYRATISSGTVSHAECILERQPLNWSLDLMYAGPEVEAVAGLSGSNTEDTIGPRQREELSQCQQSFSANVLVSAHKVSQPARLYITRFLLLVPCLFCTLMTPLPLYRLHTNS